jgi:hypothetical protein
MSTSSSSMSAGGSAGKESPGKDSKDKGGVSGSGNFGMDGSGSQASSQQGALITGRNVSVQAGTDLSMTGTVIGAQDTAKLNAGGKLDMQSAQDRSSSSSSNVSVGVGGSKGDGAGGHAGGAGGSASSENVVNRNAIVSGNNVQVTTGGDATLRGANIAGNSVSTTVGGNLSIESRADVNRASNNQAGGYIGGSTIDTHDISTNSIISQRGEIAKTGAGFNYQNSNTDSTQVTMQSGIVGQQSNTVNVTGNTNLTGARIGSDAGGAVNVTTSRLTQSAVEQSTSQSGYSIGGSAQIGNWQAPSTKTTGGSTSSTLQSSVQGTVTQTAPGAAPVTSAPASVPLAEGQTPVQPTIKLAQLGAVLNQPAVQTALKLNKGMKAAVEQYGSSDSVPVDTVRRILGDAGVAIPAGSTDRAVMVLLNNTLESGYAAATTQLGATNIPASQAGGILKAIIP